jgi:Phage major capsid protein E
MSQLESVFGKYSRKLQPVIDSSLTKFAPVWYRNYFEFDMTQASLTYETVVGRARIEAAASVTSSGAKAPIRSRANLDKYTGTIPAIQESFNMTATDYRNYLLLQNMNVTDEQKKQQALDLLFKDVKTVGDSAHKRLDIMCLEAISTGQISLDITNNPDGLVLSNPIDLFMKDANKKTATTSWATSATAKPITDIENAVLDASQRGLSFEKILMSDTLWYKFRACTQVIESVKMYAIGAVASGSSATVSTNLDAVNNYLSANQLPYIEIVNVPVGIEKDGEIATIKPFNANNASFIPSGRLGYIKNAFAIEELEPISEVSYGIFNRALIKKWRENNPFNEVTSVELNAFPSLDLVDSVYILTAVY